MTREGGQISWARFMTLGLWCGVMVWTLTPGPNGTIRLAAYLRPDLFWLPAGAVLILVALLVVTLPFGGSQTGHSPALGAARWLILALPVLYLPSTFNTTLDSHTFRARAPSHLLQAMEQEAPSPTADDAFPPASTMAPDILPPPTMPAPDTPPPPQVRLEYVVATPRAYLDQRITLTGQVAHPDQAHAANRFFLFQFMVNCCIADAIPYGLPVTLLTNQSLPSENAWVSLTGHVRTTPRANGSDATWFVADTLEIQPAPDAPYTWR